MGFNSFIDSYGAGSKVGENWRERRIEGALSDAYEGAGGGADGWDAAAKAAATEGSLRHVQYAEGQADSARERVAAGQQRERAEWQRRQTVFNNVLTSLQSVPYEQRKARIAAIAPRLQQEGFTPEQIAAYDPTDEKIAGDLAAAGVFSQFAEMKQDEAGRWIGVTRDGRIMPIEGAPAPPQVTTLTPQQSSAAGFRPGSVVQQGFDGGYNVVQAPREFSPSQMGGGDHAQWRTMTADEVSAAGLPPGTVAQVDERTGSIKTIRAQRQYSEYAGKAANFANRMQASNQILSRLETAGVNPSAIYAFGMGDRNAQAYRQAQRDFVTAVLRQESGAAIADSEFDSARQLYFPLPNDPPEVLLQKRAARQRAIDGMVQQSQGAFEEWFPPEGGGPPPSGGSGAPQAPGNAPDPLGIRR